MNNMFDKEIKKVYSNTEIEYGVVIGNNNVLFIKAGQNGSKYGYNNKYLQIASRINKKYGYSVVCSSNPFDGTNPLDVDLAAIKELIPYEIKKIYYMGHSNGALIGARWGGEYSLIKRMLLVNQPFFNWHKTEAGLSKFCGEKVIFVFGEKDPSFSSVCFINFEQQDNLSLITYIGADHNFTNKLEDFIELPERYLFDK